MKQADLRPVLLATLTAFAAAQDQTPPAPKTQAEILADLAGHAFELFQPVGLAIAVVDGDQIVFEHGYGERIKGSGEAITENTQFNIASCTKAFTAAAVGKLVESGKLGWDDLVIDHLPEFRVADAWISQHMTVRDLLCHRSGLKTFDGDLLWYGTDYTDAEVMRRMARLPITRRFREEFGYQNLMYLVAGEVVARESGMDWGDFVKQSFLAPLGMTGTSIGFAGLPAESKPAMPHIDGIAVEVTTFKACRPAAAIWSSVHDLSAWMRMLLAEGKFDGKPVLSPATLHECWKPHTVMSGGRTPSAIEDFSSYGMGWFLYVQDGKKLVEHDGGMPGYISKVTLLPADHFGIAILNNGMDGVVNIALRRAILEQRDGGDGRALLERFAKVAEARNAAAKEAVAKREAAHVAGTTPSLPLPEYAGRFEDPVLGPAEITWNGTELNLTVLPSAAKLHGVLSHWHHDVFRVDFPDRFLPFALIDFSLDVTGKVQGFRIDGPIDDFDFAALDFRRAAAGR